MDKRFVDKILGKDVIPEEICYAYECNQFRIIHPDNKNKISLFAKYIYWKF